MFRVDAGEVQISEQQPKNISELKAALLKIRDELPQDAVKKSAFASVCVLASTLASDTLNIHSKGLPFNQ